MITPVSLDHAEFLGDTVALDRGREGRHHQARRAGDRGVAVARGAYGDRAPSRAHEGAPIKIAGEDWTATEERGRLVYQDDAGLLDLPAPRLYGRHQFENAGVAIAALRAANGLRLPPAAFEAGVAKADWPARMQRLAQGPLPALLPAGSELWLDGGHNADGGRAIANALADLEERVSRPLVLVVGMLATKDTQGFLRNFAGLARRVVAVPIPRQDKSLTAEAVADAARAVGIPAQNGGDIETGACRDLVVRARSAAARRHHRLALSRRRGARGERHAAGLTAKQNGRTRGRPS